MSVYRRFSREGNPSFITTNTHARRTTFASAATCDLFISIMYAALRETRTQLLAFAVMPDHVHLIIVAGAADISKTMQLIKGRFAREYNLRVKGTGAVWQTRFHESTLATEPALGSAIEYVHNNPVAAGLVEEPEDYPFSSANDRFDTDLEDYLGG